MARDRQRAKRRQAERREARLREQGRPGDGAASRTSGRESESHPGRDDGAASTPDVGVQPDPAAEAQLAAGAPPEDTGRSDTVTDSPPPAPELDGEEADGIVEDRARGSAGDAAAPTGRERGKVAAFLVAVWAELQRVQWPNRKTLTTLTAVVLGFVLVAGGYLGLLDAIFSRVIDAII